MRTRGSHSVLEGAAAPAGDQAVLVPDGGRSARRIRTRLSVMMALQYAIWGAWLPLFFGYLSVHWKLDAITIGGLFAVAASGALLAPFIAGQIADRWFDTEKFLGLSHIGGAVLVWFLPAAGSFMELLLISLGYSIIYAPTLALTNAMAFHHLEDRERDFGKVRVWGTVGWILIGIGVGQWLLQHHSPAHLGGEALKAAQAAGMVDAFRVSSVLGIVMGLFCFTLPRTRPVPGKQRFAPAKAVAAILRAPRENPLLWVFVLAFPISVVHQFYFVHTANFLTTQGMEAGWIRRVFGVGGGGLMTIGQMSEIVVLASMPLVIRRVARKTLLTIGLSAYVLRFAIFAFAPTPALTLVALAMHGLCFGCFFFQAFLIVDERTSPDVRTSAQGLFNLVVFGFGIIAGNVVAGLVGSWASLGDNRFDYRLLFGVPALMAALALVLHLLAFPSVRRERHQPGRVAQDEAAADLG